MNHHIIDIQVDTILDKTIKESLTQWSIVVLDQIFDKVIQLSIKICDETTIQELNRNYRNKNKVTNVLSFPEYLPDEIQRQEQSFFIGDIVICPAVVKEEAQKQAKPLKNHWKHMLTHGILHLAGYDHIEDSAAKKMEALEVVILEKMGVSNPYLMAKE